MPERLVERARRAGAATATAARRPPRARRGRTRCRRAAARRRGRAGRPAGGLRAAARDGRPHVPRLARQPLGSALDEPRGAAFSAAGGAARAAAGSPGDGPPARAARAGRKGRASASPAALDVRRTLGQQPRRQHVQLSLTGPAHHVAPRRRRRQPPLHRQPRLSGVELRRRARAAPPPARRARPPAAVRAAHAVLERASTRSASGASGSSWRATKVSDGVSSQMRLAWHAAQYLGRERVEWTGVPGAVRDEVRVHGVRNLVHDLELLPPR